MLLRPVSSRDAYIHWLGNFLRNRSAQELAARPRIRAVEQKASTPDSPPDRGRIAMCERRSFLSKARNNVHPCRTRTIGSLLVECRDLSRTSGQSLNNR